MGRTKRANGEGFCYKIDNNPHRKKPFVYGFIIGWTDDGKPIKNTLGYTTSKSKGNKELDKYLAYDNKENLNDITWKELYFEWLEWKKSTGISKDGLQHYTKAYKKTLILNSRKFQEINLDIMQNIINNCGVGHDGQKRIRSLYSQLHQYAKIKGIKIPADFSKFLVVSKEKKKKREILTKEQINLLWDNRNPVVDIILFLIYTGIRPNEIYKISEATEDYIVTGSKTLAGENRTIPLHDDIKPVFKDILDSKILEVLTKAKFYKLFNEEMKRLNMEHEPYDTRHTFSTMWKLSKADDLARKRIMGHAVKDLTDNVYTHLDFNFLKTELNKVVFR